MTDLIIETVPTVPVVPAVPAVPASDAGIHADLETRLLSTQDLADRDTTEVAQPCAAAKQKRARHPLVQKAVDTLRRKLKLSSVKTNRAPVPKTIWLVWVGRTMSDEYSDRIAKAVRDNPEWKVNVLLSSTFSTSPEAYAENQAKVQAAGAAVVPLEGELAGKLKREHMLDPLIWEWSMTSGIVNYGAISDILRVFVLKEQGGMYTDTDNTIITPLPAQVVPKYGFLYGCFGSDAGHAEQKLGRPFDEDPAAYLAVWEKTARSKPSAVSNSVLATVPQGKVINAYWDHIKGVYVPLGSQPVDARMAALRWGPRDETQKAKLNAMKLKTLNNTGPGALEATLSGETIKGQNALRLAKPDYAHDVHTNEGKHLVLDPKHVYVRSDNSWVKAIDEGLGGTGPA